MYEMVGGACTGIVGIGLYGRLTLPGGIEIYLTGEELEIAKKAKLEAVMDTDGYMRVSASNKVHLAVNSDGSEPCTRHRIRSCRIPFPTLLLWHQPLRSR